MEYYSENTLFGFALLAWIALYLVLKIVLRVVLAAAHYDPGSQKGFWIDYNTLRHGMTFRIVNLGLPLAVVIGGYYLVAGHNGPKGMRNLYQATITTMQRLQSGKEQIGTRPLAGIVVMRRDDKCAGTPDCPIAIDADKTMDIEQSRRTAPGQTPRIVLILSCHPVKTRECVGACPGGHEFFSDLCTVTRWDVKDGSYQPPSAPFLATEESEGYRQALREAEQIVDGRN
ncbi:hypothetical protein [Rhizomicrobium electricum]|uniref:Uncharacterized protein n=1 Tax=Rhizomicrobium electricum TaxID=480070 RepID=A0ABP3PFA6_9PROT|nr:hypothetical protein [Rhizomicrobium electricum]NIJ48522.1 hypothetical protein [Rhizomicrobium electricum]